MVNWLVSLDVIYLSGVQDQVFFTVSHGLINVGYTHLCCLQLLLALASTVIFRSKSHRFHHHILLSQIQNPLSIVSDKLICGTHYIKILIGSSVSLFELSLYLRM
jgi:hypothetical protein